MERKEVWMFESVYQREEIEMRGKAREGEDQPSCEAACDSRMAFTMFTPPATSYNGYKEDIKHLR